MHSLEVIHARDVAAVVREFREALADGRVREHRVSYRSCRCPEAGSVGVRENVSLTPLDGADDARVPTELVTAPDISESRWADVNRKFCELFR